MIHQCLLLLSSLPYLLSEVIVFQNGRVLQPLTGTPQTYTKSTDVSITTTYLESWNYYNGHTYFLGSTPTRFIAEQSTKYRTLLKFPSLHEYIPPNATILSSDITLTFVNWNSDANLAACFITKPWNDFESSRYKDTGWRFNRWNPAMSQSESWTEPGAWSDCDPRVKITIPVPGNGAYGNVTRVMPLDPLLVQGWIQNSGSQNYGILMKALYGNTYFLSNAGNAIQYTPSLRIKYTTDPTITPPVTTYPAYYYSGGREIYVAPYGSDITGTGLPTYPYATPKKALFEAFPNDIVLLMTGVYPGSITINRPHITLQSAYNQFGVIAAPLNDPIGSVNAITIRSPAKGGVIRNLEITGGFYYGIMFFSDWENYASMSDRVNQADAPRDFVLENLRIHHTGSSCVKMTMKVTNIKFSSNEISHCGHRYRTYGHGIEGVQAHSISIYDSYIHHIAGAGIHLVGGSSNSDIQRNFIHRTNFGINMGFATEYEYMDPIHNPSLFENLNSFVGNNILTQTYQAGINLWAAKNVTLLYNTLWTVQHIAQNAIVLNSFTHDDAPNSPTIGCEDINIIGNILTKSKLARVGPIIQIRNAGLNQGTMLNMGHNVYYDEKAFAPPVFRWGVGVMIEDEGTGSFIGNLSSWSNYCTTQLLQSYCDINSIEANPELSPSFDPTPCSPAINRLSFDTLPPSVPRVFDDFHGRIRYSFDSGAVSSFASGSVKSIPPIPHAFAHIPPYFGPGKEVAHYNQYTWPYQFWLTRECRDLFVNSETGNDAQPFNYESNYSQPFKTISAALTHINQCDRILLEGGQTHPGPFGIYRPNVTIMTNPAHSTPATVLCHNLGERNCIMTGEGFYDGAAAVQLLNFKIMMTGGGTGDCIRLNEGYGGGFSPYWKFYVETSHRENYNRGGNTIISNIEMYGCHGNGIKLSTFISNVVIMNTKIINAKKTAIEMRNGNNVLVQNCHLEHMTSGIVMGGGSKNNIIERNVIRNYNDRGIIVGSDNTEVQYMDVEYAERNINGSWHDAINCTIRNNIIANGVGAGVSFYSARDIIVTHNTLVNISLSSQAAILFNLSPKLVDYGVQLYPENKNIVISDNIIQSGGPLSLPMVESRIMQSSVKSIIWPSMFPEMSNCSNHNYNNNTNNNTATRKLMGASQYLRKEKKSIHEIKTTALPFIPPTGTQGRNADGTCPQFPDSNLWHIDVSSFPVHPNSDSIKMLISSGSRMHHDFAGGVTKNGKFIPYGIPFITVNTDGPSPQPLVPITIASTGYPEECDYPLLYPFPDDAPVEGAYLNCPDETCPGDRHVLVLDNSTCTLYETWRSFPPQVTNEGWVADIAVKWNLLSNELRPLGYTSSDAAGLAVLPGLVQFKEVIIDQEIKHALRFTGPNSRAAYSLPATHFAPTGDTGSDSPWMGMRIRLKSTFDCSTFARASRVFCVALQKYGGIFADNGSPWYFSGEATTDWNPYLSELSGIGEIAASDIEVLDSGCLCLTADCSISDCGNGASDDLPVHSAIKNYTTIHLSRNMYWNVHGNGARFTDRRAGYLGNGFDGSLEGWKNYTNTDTTSVEVDPEVDPETYRLKPTSPGLLFSPVPNYPMTDFFGREIKSTNGSVTVGVIFEGYDTLPPTPYPTHIETPPPRPTRKPTRDPTWLPTWKPSREPTVRPSKTPTREPTLRPSKPPSREPTLRPSKPPSREPTLRPSKPPSREPTLRPSKPPSREPTLRPSRAPTTFRPSRAPTTFRPTRLVLS